MTTVYILRRMAGFGAAAAVALAFALPIDIDARQAPAQGACRITGHATSASQPLPGVAIAVKSGTALRVATSTDVDGGYGVNLAPGQYTLTAELTGFTHLDQPITVSADATCAQTVNLTMTLAPRQPLAPAPLPAAAVSQQAAAANAPNGGGRGAQPASGHGAQPGNQRVQVQVQPQTDPSAMQTTATEVTPAEEAAA